MAYRTIPNESILPVALAEFDSLPDSALVDARTIAGLMGCSINTIWRRSKAKKLPAPVRVSEAQTRWRVGDVRKALNSLASTDECA
ncbi:transcriptional regulator [Accumulibacter sp.]|uniref:helix-turn-helix transcriptional regulator n=1 Tax=Accumulibacter sp. TaxID=2053492 RepID=UPI00262E059F|nr:transcriptional regulator [Accumulibacter sp.]